jgi:hypothetical protein
VVEETAPKNTMMGSSMGKGLSSSFGLLGAKNTNNKNNQRLMMGMSVGLLPQEGDRKPNIDPHKILGEVLSIGMARKRKARELGKSDEEEAFISEAMVSKRKE